MKKMFLFLILFLIHIGILVAQKIPNGLPSKTPMGKKLPFPVSVKKVSVNLDLPKFEYRTDNGRIEISYAKHKQEDNDVKTRPKESQSPKCLTDEEVRGQKVENNQVIAEPELALQILPGGVIDAESLLSTGEFRYIKMDNRKTISLSTSANPAKDVANKVHPVGNRDITNQLRTKVHELTRASNIKGMPNVRSNEEMDVSTLNETVGVNIGASFFYMGVSAKNNFGFSSSKFRYMYIYKFEQVCLPVFANQVSSPDDLFRDPTSMNNDWLYVQEVNYGRRLFIIIESETELQKISDKLQGKLNWGVVSAAYKQSIKTSSLYTKTSMRAISQGGQPFRISDPANIDKELDKYFDAPFRNIDIVPLSYKLTFMDGVPASIISSVFLNGKNCLKADKIRVGITKIKCINVDDNKNNEEVYGFNGIQLYNSENKPLAIDGKTVMPQIPGVGQVLPGFTFGTKEAPLVMHKGSEKSFNTNQEGKYIDFGVVNLDMKLVLKPSLHEKDNVFNADDDFFTEDDFGKTIRELLMDGTTNPVFEFRRKNSVFQVHLYILPL